VDLTPRSTTLPASPGPRWYRLRVTLDAAALAVARRGELALTLGPMRYRYDLYVNGVLERSSSMSASLPPFASAIARA
jgi:hypothetical protein